MANRGKFYESEFEIALVELLEKTGWTYTHGDDLPNRKQTEPLAKDDLRRFLQTKYADRKLTDMEFEGVVANIENVGGQNEYESARNAISLYRNGYDFRYSDNRSMPFRLDYIDFDTPSNNIFRVVNQFTMIQGTENRRPDVLLFINGIPVCIFELKNPTDVNATIFKAHAQICTRYMRDIPVMMKYCALAVISDEAQNKLGTPFTPCEFFYEWKKVNGNEKPAPGLDTLLTLVNGALTPERLLEILRDYVYFPDPTNKDDRTEIECRYPQFFATRKLRNHILGHLRSNGGDGKGGLYFGATGCGKTYTMLFLARQLALRCKTALGSPTILIIVDREDLESQSAALFLRSKEFLQDNTVRVFESRAELKTELTLRKSGGIFITTIQKFNEELGLLSERANIICMSDEAHRSQNNIEAQLKINDPTPRRRIEAKEGERSLIEADRLTDIINMIEAENRERKTNYGAEIAYGFAQHLRTALPNATYIGFTGTPIDECKDVFGEIVDQYTMREAVRDGITVDIKYDPRLVRVSKNEELTREVENYYVECDKDGATAEDIMKSKSDMSSMCRIIGNEKRLAEVAKDIIGDYEIRQENSLCLQKAMITCIDRQTAFKLYRIMRSMKPEWFEPRKALDESTLTDDDKARLNSVAYVNMVATRDKDDEKELYDLLGDKEYRKWLSNEFKSDKSNFHIAIVVDMWITGFDCPSLTILYNDKPLQKHTLIQTISRVNRRYKTKELGFVVDYIGIRKEMLEALKMYGGDDTIEVDDVDKAYEVFQGELAELRKMTEKIDFTPFFGDNALQRLIFLQKAADFILQMDDGDDGEASFMSRYRQHVKRLKLAFDICNPAGKTTDDETKWCLSLMGINSYLTKLTSKVHDAASMNRHVEGIVNKALEAQEVEFLLEKEDDGSTLFGDEILEEIQNTPMPYTRFQLLCKLLERAIKGLSGRNKVRAEEFQKMLQDTIDRYNNRRKLIEKTTHVASDVISAVDAEVSKLSDRLVEFYNMVIKETEHSSDEKPYYDILVSVRDKHGFEYPKKRCEELAVNIGEIVREKSKIPDFINNSNVRDDMRVDILNVLMEYKYPPEFDNDIFDEVANLFLEQLKR